MSSDVAILRPMQRRTEGRGQSRFSARRMAIPDVVLVETALHRDARGAFAETWRQSDFSDLGLPDFVQDNQVSSPRRGTLRGLHFQRPPHAQSKLVRPIRGAIFDVAVDLREESPTFGTWVGASLSADEGQMLFVPRGFAHGYCTLEDDTTVAYRCDAYYQPECEGGVNAFDTAIGIEWPIPSADMILSHRDLSLPSLGDVAPLLIIGGVQ
jgi:dTDP-4-dehydrorhamnose 3,5-epimerase